MRQPLLFDNLENDWEREWVGMPEYNNVPQPDPLITATFKFRSEDDFIEFMEVVKKYVYNGCRVFDGTQRETRKVTWYPLTERPSSYIYTDEPDES